MREKVDVCIVLAATFIINILKKTLGDVLLVQIAPVL
jgi:hypothetical protein